MGRGRALGARSIPACTGKPDPVRLESPRCWVYPRMYGETDEVLDGAVAGAGLSPHVRGNRSRPADGRGWAGSIPACTGKPLGGPPGGHDGGVYPRMYGKTSRSSGRSLIIMGLSPHVRGNRGGFRGREGVGGSIPACTGKPASSQVGRLASTVYPRMYGETDRGRDWRPCVQGLSPHVRGNPAEGDRPERRHGSIPACTGKPGDCAAIASGCGVYPRMYGETAEGAHRAVRAPGLSPHVRGNPHRSSVVRHRAGSIPACTGKPRSPES